MNVIKSIATPIKKLLALLAGAGGALLLGTSNGNSAQVELNLKPTAVVNIAALRASTTATLPATIVDVLDYFWPLYTGGGGIFSYDASDVASLDDGGKIIVDASGRRWKRQISGDIKVPFFGTKGNGSAVPADVVAETAAIQAAINAAGIGGRVLFTNTTTGFRISSLQMLKGQTFEGTGRENPGLVGDGSGVCIKTNAYPAAAYPVRNVRLKGLNVSNTNYNAVQLHGAPDSSVQECTFQSTGASAFSKIMSVRCAINKNRILTSGDFYAATFLNNCNGTDASNNIISGGAGGSAVIVSLTQTLNLDNLVNEVGQYNGASIASSKILGNGFTNGEAVTVTALDGSGGGCTGTATVVHGILTAVAIVGGGAGFTNGESVIIANAANSQSWGHATATVVAGAVTALVDANGGSCSGISMRVGYYEQVRRPVEIGLVYAVYGIDLTGTYIGNTNTSSVASRDSAIHLGRVQGLVIDSLYPNGTGAEALFELYDPTLGAGPIPYLEASRIYTNRVVGYSANFIKNAAFVSAAENRIFGKNLIQVTANTPIGYEREWFSPLITANVAYPITQAVEATVGGGFITAIDIIDKVGTVTCTLQVGYSGSITDTVDIDPNTLVYSQGYVRYINEASAKYVRPNEGLRMRTIAGVGTGTFRVRIRYRV